MRYSCSCGHVAPGQLVVAASASIARARKAPSEEDDRVTQMASHAPPCRSCSLAAAACHTAMR